MPLADHRPNDRAVGKRIAYREALRALDKALRKLHVDRLLHQNARAGSAALAVVRKDHENSGVERAFEIGVVENNEWRFAAEFHRELLEPRGLHDPVTCRGR